MTNEERAAEIIEKYGFDFENIPKQEIRSLIKSEIINYHSGSSEYIRLLCGYLFCIGDKSDVPLLEKAKYGINMDVGCMIDLDWIDSLKNGGEAAEYLYDRDTLIRNFVDYYKSFEPDDLDDF